MNFQICEITFVALRKTCAEKKTHMYVCIYIYYIESVRNTHEAKWSRAKAVADTRRTGGNIFRAAISSARSERTSRLRARAAWLDLSPTSSTPKTNSQDTVASLKELSER
jgi:hypothetical protein